MARIVLVAAIGAALGLAGCTSKPASSVPNAGSARQAISTWPSDAQWLPLRNSSGLITDLIGDSQGSRDVIGGLVGSTAYPAIFVFSDSERLYFRLRLAKTPVKSGSSLDQLAWACGLDTDANHQTYEFLANVNGITSGDAVELMQNTSTASNALDSPTDSSEQTLGTYSALADNIQGATPSHARVLPAPAPALGGGTTDSFVDFAVEVADFAKAVAGPGFGFDPLTDPFEVFCGSSGKVRSVTADLVSASGQTTISGLLSDPVVCGAGGCVAACLTDSQCTTAQFCDTVSSLCVPKLANGAAIPVLAGHTPVLDGTCAAGVGAAVCLSGVCDADHRCGYGLAQACTLNGECRSTLCDPTTLVCVPPPGCASDAACNGATQYCDTGTSTCTGKLSSGQPIPTITGHSPVIDAVCTAEVGAIVCLAGTCDTNHLCGLMNGGTCTLPAECQSAVCNTDSKCGDPNGTACTVDDTCRSGVCNPIDLRCGDPVGQPCVAATTCRVNVCEDGYCGDRNGDSCTDGTTCRVGLCVGGFCGSPNGDACTGALTCRSGVCNADGFCGDPNGAACSSPLTCRSGVCNADGFCGDPNGTACTGATTCRSAVCNADGFCGDPNGTACTGATTCRSAVCNTDGLCGDPNGAGCSSATTCRSAVCEDGSCGDRNGDPCTDGTTCQVGICVTGFCGSPNGDACTLATTCRVGLCVGGACGSPSGDPCVAALTCRAGVCVDGLCGGRNGDPCTSDESCASLTCAPDGLCGDPNGTPCTASTTCRSGACVSGLCGAPNGDPCASGTDCISLVCASDGQCGQPNGDPCAASNRCRSGVCSAGVCGLENGSNCASDGACASEHCVDGFCCNSTCSGACDACNVAGQLGTCTAIPANQPGTPSCSPYRCDGASATCPASCPSDAACAAGFVCVQGTCRAPLAAGASCQLDAECGSGHCADGVCCDRACEGQCEACALPGTVGVCAAVLGAPRGDRPACDGDGSVCGGTCDGVNLRSCAYPTAATACRDGSCEAGIALVSAGCNGRGACPAPLLVACAPYRCAGQVCGAACSSDAACVAGTVCVGGACTPRLADGGRCADDRECLSHHCVDGFCCNSPCLGQCEACDVGGSAGVCTPVAGMPHGDRLDCFTDGSACGGTCGGADRHACVFPGPDRPCREAACADGVAIVAAACDGAGACPPLQTQPCAPSVCGPSACVGECVIDEDCPSKSSCLGGFCVPQRAPGEPCGAPAQCATGFCADGVCCDGACDGQCAACDLPASVGTCAAVTGAPRRGHPSCASDGLCGGACDGQRLDACAYPGPEILCRPASCDGDLATLAATCDGRGGCAALQTQTCEPVACADGTCAGGCTVDTDCGNSRLFCAAGVCVPRFGDGTPCARDAQCSSGRCVDGLCCDQACAGQCEACDLPGAKGRCVAIVGAPHNARPQCASDGTSCGGACDGVRRAVCVFPGPETACRAPRCAEGLATRAASCDGRGACPRPETVRCAPFTCGETACAGQCAADEDCVGGHYCAAGVCRPRQPDGAPCSSAAECRNGLCVDGVCCDRACGGPCEACNLAGSEGTCRAVEGAPVAPRPACPGEGACAGACDGVDGRACRPADEGERCGPMTCRDGVATAAPRCDGAGVCVEGASTDCGAYACGPLGCLHTCWADGDCAAHHVCVRGTCERGTGGGQTPSVTMTGGCGCAAGAGGAAPLALAWGLGLLARRALRRRGPAPAAAKEEE